MSDERFDCLEQRLQAVEEKLDSVLEMVAVGKGALLAAKVVGGLTSFFVAGLEIWRNFLRH